MNGYYVRRKILFCVLIFVLILSFLPGRTHAAATEESGHFLLTTYYWKPTTSGDVTVDGQTSTHNMDTRESLETSNFGGILKGEKWNGRWGLSFDLLLIALKDESRSGATQINATLDTSMTEFSFLWRLADRTTGGALMHDASSTGWVVDLEGGVRHTRADLELEFDPGVDGSDSHNWVEPFTGGRFLYRPSRKWILGLSLDAGGFGIGAASDLTWNFSAGADYRLGEKKWVQVGYRMMGIEYTVSNGQAGADMQILGPMAAIRMDF